MPVVNILIGIVSLLIIGGFIDFLWHTGKMVKAGRDRVSIALFLFFLALALLPPWVWGVLILSYLKINDTDLISWSFLVVMLAILTAMIFLRVALFGTDGEE